VLGACASSTSVERVIHGRTVEGPEVSEDAYSAYARGAYLEARGQSAAAIQAYEEAREWDSTNPGIGTRLGVLYCRERPKDAEDAFDDALELDTEYAPAWAARAECRYSHGQLDAALADASRAVRLDASDTAANLLVANVYRAQDRLVEARAWLFALVLRSPEANAHWAALRSLAESAHDDALGRFAASELERRRARRQVGAEAAPGAKPAPANLSSELVAALNAGDLPGARAIAAREQISPRTLAVLVMMNGYPALAERQATLLLEADPADPDALITALTAAEITGATPRLEALLRQTSSDRRPSPLGARLFADLVRWLVDGDAARDWLDAYEKQR
jgi:tetratricopeptide (TPR) repeat protein